MSTPTKAVDILFRNGADYPELEGINLVDHYFEEEDETDNLEGTAEIRYNGDPVLEYAFSNVSLKIDPADNWKIDKQESGGKVDPCVAMVMAYGQYLDYKKRDKYDIGIGVAVI